MINTKTTDYRLQTTEKKTLTQFSLAVDQKGFTLIEILVAIMIIGLVFGVIISSINAIGARSRDQQRTTDLHSIQAALAQYRADQTFYPDASFNISTATELTDDQGNQQVSTVSKVYLGRLPRDPRATAYCYIPQAAFSGGACDSDPVTPVPSCQFYQLCARFENAPPGPTDCPSVCGASYNWGVDPQNSGT